MKISITCFFAIFAYTSAGTRPQLTISVRDGNFDGIYGLDPTISWENTNNANDVYISYGIKAAARPTTDIASLPRSIWGKARTNVQGWNVAAKAEVEGQNLNVANLEIDADSAASDLSARLTATAGSNFNFNTFEATKGFYANGARFTVTPRFNLQNDNRDVVINYERPGTNTNIQVIASEDTQEVTLSQQLDSKNRIAPTVSNKGDLSIEWERRLSDSSTILANLRRNECLDIEWRDDAWTAYVNMPFEGSHINGANISIKRDIVF